MRRAVARCWPRWRRGACAARPRRVASKSQWSIFEDHTALVQSGVDRRVGTLQRGSRTLGAGHAADRVPAGTRSRRARSPRRSPTFNAAIPAAYQGALNALSRLRAVRRPRAPRATRWASGSSSRSPATRRAGRPPAARAGASRPPTTRSTRPTTRSSRRPSRGATRATSRACPAIHYFSIWNEPNHKQFLKPLQPGAAIYRQLVDSGVPGDPRQGGVSGAKVFVGETAPSGVAGKSTGPRAFFQKWLCLNKRWKRITERQLQALQEGRRGRLRAPSVRAPRAASRASATRSTSA